MTEGGSRVHFAMSGSILLLFSPFSMEAPDDPPQTILAGPEVVETVTESELFTRGFNGMVEPIEGDPFVLAVQSLQLSEEQSLQAEAVLLERYSMLDEIVGRNYGLLTEAGTINWDDWGDDPERDLRRAIVFRDLLQAFSPNNARGTYIEELRGTIPDELLDHAESEARAYYRARVEGVIQGEMAMDDAAEMMSMQVENDRMTSEQGQRWRDAYRNVRLEQFLSVIAGSFERQTGNGDAESGEFAERLDLEPAQLARIEAIFGPIFIDELQRKEIPPMRRIKALGQLLMELKPAQRRIFLRDMAKDMARAEGYRRRPMAPVNEK